MDLRLDALQVQLARGVGATLAGAGDGDVWAQAAELGVLALGVPVADGGLGLGLSAEVVVGRELGRALEPLPGYRETALAAGVLAEVRRGGPPSRLLAGVAAGEARLAAAGLCGGAALELDGGGRLRGRSELLAPGEWRAAVVRARTRGDDALLLVDLPAPGSRAEAVATLAGPQARLVFEGAAGEVLRRGGVGPAIGRALAAARVRQAALLLGIADAAARTAWERARRRAQFGRRLVEFQSVAHRLAALAAEAEGASLLVHEAAWRWDRCLRPEPAAGQALAATAELALRAARLAVQLHGAGGLLTGSVPERAYRLASVEATRLGTPAELWREAGARRVAEAAPDG